MRLWPFHRRTVARSTTTTATPGPTIPSGVVADVWNLIVDPHPTGGRKPTVSQLEDAYCESDVLYSTIQEIAQAVSMCEITGNVGAVTLLEHPNPLQDWGQFITQWLAAFSCTGAAYVLKLPVGGELPQQLEVLATSGVNMTRGTCEDPFARIDYSDGFNVYNNLKPEQLIIKINPSPKGCTVPVSPVYALWDAIQADIMRSRFQREALRRLPFLVGVAKPQENINKTQRDQLQTSIQQIMGGSVLVLPGKVDMSTPEGMVNLLTLPGLAEQIESRVTAALNTPAILVGFRAGLERSTYANYQEARMSFQQETVAPILAQLSDLFSDGLGQTVKLSLPASTPSSPEAQGPPPDESANTTVGERNAAPNA